MLKLPVCKIHEYDRTKELIATILGSNLKNFLVEREFGEGSVFLIIRTNPHRADSKNFGIYFS